MEKKEKTFVVVLFLLALALRLVGSFWGLWADFEMGGQMFSRTTLVPDEGDALSQLGHILQERNPFFMSHLLHGPVHAWISSLFAGVLFVLNGFANPSIPSVMYIGRLVSIVAGALTVVVFYLIGKRFNFLTGLFASVLLLVNPLHVVRSKWMNPGVLDLLWISLAFWFALRAFDTGRRRDYALIGVFLALSAGTKYFGVLFLALPLLVYFFTQRFSVRALIDRRVILSYLSFLVVFVYTMGTVLLINIPKALDFLQTTASYQNSGGYGNNPIAWPNYLSYILPNVVTIFVFVLAVVALFWLVRSKKGWILVLASVVPFVALQLRHVKTFHWAFLLFPVIFVGVGFVLSRLFMKRTVLGLVLIFLTIGNSAVVTLAYTDFFVQEDSYVDGAKWILENVPVGTSIGFSDRTGYGVADVVSGVEGYTQMTYEELPAVIVTDGNRLLKFEKYFALRERGYEFSAADWSPAPVPTAETYAFYEDLREQKSYRLVKVIQPEGKFLWASTEDMVPEFIVPYGYGIYVYVKR